MTRLTGSRVKVPLPWNLTQELVIKPLVPPQYMLLQSLPYSLAIGMSPTAQECLVSGLNSSAELRCPPELKPPTIKTPEKKHFNSFLLAKGNDRVDKAECYNCSSPSALRHSPDLRYSGPESHKLEISTDFRLHRRHRRNSSWTRRPNCRQ